MPTISSARPDEWRPALDLAFQHLGDVLRQARVANALTLVKIGEIQPEGLLVARDEKGILTGAIVAVLLKGKSGLVWPPQTRPCDPVLEEKLVTEGLAWLRARGAKQATALLPPADRPLAAPLLRCGFLHATALQYLNHSLERLPDMGSKAAPALRLESYQPGNRDLFHATLDRTYEGTLDCPELNGVRSVEEAIEGHIAQGKFRPERWWLAWEGSDSRPVAVALATEVPDGNVWDLSYLGVVPEARGRGIGRRLTFQVLQQAKKSRAEAVILAVDVRNKPALQLYRDLGFESADIREVYLFLWCRTVAGPRP